MQTCARTSIVQAVLTIALATGALTLAGCAASTDAAELVTQKCGPCHADLSSYASSYSSTEEWEACIKRMQQYTDQISDSDVTDIARHLAEQGASN